MQANEKHRGNITQIPIHLGKFFRMFIFMNDWKVIPTSAIVAGLVGYVVSPILFATMEGTFKGAMAITFVCIWNGCFNSIQSVCRERDIVKREHRLGLHMSAYIFAHMIYQAFICLLQTVITIGVLSMVGVIFPDTGLFIENSIYEYMVTLFLITYAADMLSLLVSSIVKNTTTAMTVMPFILIFQLVFSGSIFELNGNAKGLSNLTIARWGIDCICTQADYNEMSTETAYKMLKKNQDVEYNGSTPIKDMMVTVDATPGGKAAFCKESAKSSVKSKYELTTKNVTDYWGNMLIFIILCPVLAIMSLRNIDKDKR